MYPLRIKSDEALPNARERQKSNLQNETKPQNGQYCSH